MKVSTVLISIQLLLIAAALVCMVIGLFVDARYTPLVYLLSFLSCSIGLFLIVYQEIKYERRT